MSTPTNNNRQPARQPQNGTRTFNTVGAKKPAAGTVKKTAAPKKTVQSTPAAPKRTTRRRKKNTLGKSLAKFIAYIVFVIAVSVLLSAFVINVANDMFAFLKDDTVISVEIPENASTSQVAKILARNDIIDFPGIFGMYTDFKKGKSSYYKDGYKSGSFELSPNTNYDDLIYALSNAVGARQVVRLTFPEGSTVDEIINILIKGGIDNTREEYIDVIENYDFSYRFIEELDVENFKKGRKYRLEGYLFPDTYDFYTDAGAVDVINKFLSNFNNKFDDTFYDAAKKNGYSVDDIITIASLIEKESRRSADMGKISSVFHNRLKNRSTFPYLQSDATIQYAFAERKTQITPDDLEYDNPYNTYIYAGLPPSAVANPGLDAITNALFPENTGYFYFVANTKGETLFATTLPGHNANVAAVQREKAKS